MPINIKKNDDHASGLLYANSGAAPLKRLLLSLAVLTLCLPAWVWAASTPNLGLTMEEKIFLQQHQVFRLGVGIAFPPFQFVEETTTGPVFKGIVSDYLKILEERLDVRLEPVYGINFKQALAMGRSGEIDLFPAVSRTPEREEFLSYTQPYISYPLVIITRDDSSFVGSVNDLNGKKVALVKHLANYSKFTNDLADVKMDFHFEPDVKSVMTAVSLGKADACVVNLAVASYLINQLGLSNLKVAAPTPWETNKLAMAARKELTLLPGIIQKGLDSITIEESQEIAQRWINLKYEPFTDPRLMRNVIIPGGITALLIIAIVVLWNWKLKKEIKKRHKIEKDLSHLATHDQLTGLPNRTLFMDRLNQALASAKRSGYMLALMFIDFDDFKSINDIMGHHAGDEVLKTISRRLAELLRESDTVGRIGGDEFVVTLPLVNKPDAALKVAKKLLETISKPMLVNDIEVVIEASVGIALYPEHGSDASTLLSAADGAMYMAKQAGKAGVHLLETTNP
jgi:diguanylate cyclase (GGDEF)-like protein